MDIALSLSGSGSFRRITLSLSEEPEQLELSAVVIAPSGREEIFLPSPEKVLPQATYAQSGGRFVTHIGKGKYQLIYQPREPGPHGIKLMGRMAGKPFQEKLQIVF